MAEHPVHWEEGLFLRPQHFQLSERHLREQIRLVEDWNVGYAYGIQDIKIDQDALKNWRIVVRNVNARLPDGTHLRFPEDASLADFPLPKDAFRSPDDRVMVYLGVPSMQEGRGNVGETGQPEEGLRFFAKPQEVEDENKAGNSNELKVRWHNARILLGRDKTAGYSAVPIMRLKLGPVADAPPEIDPDYFPPLLNCSAWKDLNAGILESIYDYLGAKCDYESMRMVQGGVAFDVSQLESNLRLHSFNIAYGYMWNLPFVRNVHPLLAYMELCRIAGLLAIFNRDRRLPADLPRYDHDDLAKCFYAVKGLIYKEDEPVPYEQRDFVWNRTQSRVRIEDKWLSADFKLFIGVQSKLQLQELNSLFGGQELRLKIGASHRVEEYFLKGYGGIGFNPERQPPACLPVGNWTYWGLEKSSPFWKDVAETLDLAIRFHADPREQSEGQRMVRVRRGSEDIVLEFTLFAVRAEAAK